LKRVLKKFKDKGEAAVSKDLLQLYTIDTLAPQKSDELSHQQHRDALESLMFLKEKKDGSIKGWTCADGRKQREESVKSDATSPTVTLKSVFITSTVDVF
jgi:hypothetical protein